MSQFDVTNSKHLGGAMGHQKVSTTFLTLLQRVKAHLLLRYCTKNLSIGVAWGALLNLFLIFEYMTTEPFGDPLSVDFPDVKKKFLINTHSNI